jgi:hypothetical protein
MSTIECAAPDCKAPVVAKGYCTTHYQRQRRALKDRKGKHIPVFAPNRGHRDLQDIGAVYMTREWAEKLDRKV